MVTRTEDGPRVGQDAPALRKGWGGRGGLWGLGRSCEEWVVRRVDTKFIIWEDVTHGSFQGRLIAQVPIHLIACPRGLSRVCKVITPFVSNSSAPSAQQELPPKSPDSAPTVHLSLVPPLSLFSRISEPFPRRRQSYTPAPRSRTLRP
jgi:hypothetical protein